MITNIIILQIVQNFIACTHCEPNVCANNTCGASQHCFPLCFRCRTTCL